MCIHVQKIDSYCRGCKQTVKYVYTCTENVQLFQRFQTNCKVCVYMYRKCKAIAAGENKLQSMCIHVNHVSFHSSALLFGE